MPLVQRLRLLASTVRGYLALALTLLATGAVVPPRRLARRAR